MVKMDNTCEHKWILYGLVALCWYSSITALICTKCADTKCIPQREVGSAIVHGGNSARIPTGVVTR